jgi:RNA polymerase sigma-70 factor (ECF subfamily)
VVKLARRFTGDDADALDVLQETFLYVLRKVPHLRLDGRLTTFLYPVVRHIALELNRKRRWLGQGEPMELQMFAAPTQPDSDRAELATLVSSLPAAQREVLLMRFVDDMQLDEIALALKIPLGTVKSRLHSAIATLRSSPKILSYFDPT